MINISARTKELYKSDSIDKQLTVKFTTDMGDFEFGNSQIYSESLELSESILDGSTMAFIGCIASEMKIKLRSLIKGEPIQKVYFTSSTLQIPNTSEDKPVTFYISATSDYSGQIYSGTSMMFMQVAPSYSSLQIPFPALYEFLGFTEILVNDTFKISWHDNEIVAQYIRNNNVYDISSLVSAQGTGFVIDADGSANVFVIQNQSPYPFNISQRNAYIEYEEQSADISLKSAKFKGYPISVNIQTLTSDIIPLFNGFIDNAEWDNDKEFVSITAYDLFYTLSKINAWNWYEDYFDGLNSVRLYSFLTSLRNYLYNEYRYNITLDVPQSIIESPIRIYNHIYNRDLSFLDILKNICQVFGVCARMKRTRDPWIMEFMYLNNYSTDSISYYRSFKLEDSIKRPFGSGITIQSNTNDIGATLTFPAVVSPSWYTDDDYQPSQSDKDFTPGGYVIRGNLFTDSMGITKREYIISYILTNTMNSNYEFTTFNLLCNGLPYLECGDHIRYYDNKFTSVYDIGTTLNESGVVFYFDYNNEIHVSGTAQQDIELLVSESIYSFVNTKVYGSGCPVGGSDTTYYGKFTYSDRTIVDTGDFVFIGNLDIYNIRYYICIKSGTTVDGVYTPSVGVVIPKEVTITNRRLKGIQAMTDEVSFDVSCLDKVYGGTANSKEDSSDQESDEPGLIKFKIEDNGEYIADDYNAAGFSDVSVSVIFGSPDTLTTRFLFEWFTDEIEPLPIINFHSARQDSCMLIRILDGYAYAFGVTMDRPYECYNTLMCNISYDSTWTPVRGLDGIVDRDTSDVVVYNGAFHKIGVSDPGAQNYYHYVSENNTWVPAGDGALPFEAIKISAIVFQDAIHVIGNGGIHYSWGGDEWVQHESVPAACSNAALVEFRGRLHVIGGEENPTMHYAWNGGKWESLSTLPVIFNGVFKHQACVYKKKIHIIGDAGSDLSYYRTSYLHYMWNGSVWERCTDMPYLSTLSGGTVFEYNSCLYTFGGNGGLMDNLANFYGAEIEILTP